MIFSYKIDEKYVMKIKMIINIIIYNNNIKIIDAQNEIKNMNNFFK